MATGVLLYDYDCGFCRWTVSKILDRDRARLLRGVPLQSREASELLAGMDLERRMASWHLVTNGRVNSGGAAVPPLARLLPAGAPIAVLAEVFPRLTNQVYRWMADHRDWLGRVLGQPACAVDPSDGSKATQRP